MDNTRTFCGTGRIGQFGIKEAGKSCVLEASVAVNHSEKRDGKYESVTTWYRVKMWGPRATSIAGMLDKGAFVGFSGDLEPRAYSGRDGKTGLSLDVNNAEITMGPKMTGQPRSATSPQHTSGPERDYYPDSDPDGDGEADAIAGAHDETPF